MNVWYPWNPGTIKTERIQKQILTFSLLEVYELQQTTSKGAPVSLPSRADVIPLPQWNAGLCDQQNMAEAKVKLFPKLHHKNCVLFFRTVC